MDKTIEIRPLARDDGRGDFSCGQPDLDRFFEHYAGQNQFKLHLAVTYVAVVEGVREGLLHGEPLPMFLAIDTIASVLEG